MRPGPRSAAEHLIHSAVGISHPHQQENMRADMPGANSILRSFNVSCLCASAGANNVVALSPADDVINGLMTAAATLVMAAVMFLLHRLMLRRFRWVSVQTRGVKILPCLLGLLR